MSGTVDQLAADWIELAGYAASALVFLSFYMKTLISLRLIAIAASVVFILYALATDLLPVLLLHGALLPLNLYRTYEQFFAYRRVRATATGIAEVETLVPLMRRKHSPSGTVLFLKGDHADSIYYLSAGSVDIPELGKTLEPGALFGEVGLFTPDQTRTASAVCGDDCELMVISQRDIVRHCMKEPAFGLYLTKLIAGRMQENQG